MLAWSHMKRLGQSKTLKTSYVWLIVVPIAARALAGVQGSVQIEAFGWTWDLAISLPFSWKAFYISAVAFAVANSLYRLRCPLLIRDFNNPTQLTSEGRSGEYLTNGLITAIARPHPWLAKRARRSEEEDERSLGAARKHVLARYLQYFVEPSAAKDLERVAVHPRRYGVRLAGYQIKAKSFNTAFWMVWEWADSSDRWFRSTTGALYVIGLTLLVVVGMENLIFVLFGVPHAISELLTTIF